MIDWKTMHLWTALVACLAAVPAVAAAVGGVVFSPTARAGGQDLALRGAEMYRHLGLFKVYSTALYLPADAAAADALAADTPRRLEIAYLRAIKAEDLVRSGDAFLRKNTTGQEYASLADDLARINGWYRSVREGDRYTLTYVPGEGTRLLLNGEEQGLIPGERFARFYFRIWLGENPVSAPVRDALLGGA